MEAELEEAVPLAGSENDGFNDMNKLSSLQKLLLPPRRMDLPDCLTEHDLKLPHTKTMIPRKLAISFHVQIMVINLF